VAQRRFALQPLLERSRRIEERCLRDWFALERDRLRYVQTLALAEGASFEACGGPATTDWWQIRMAHTTLTMRESLREVESRQHVASATLQAAKLQRRVYEKLEDRFLRAERHRRERRERYEREEANAATQTAIRRAL
jgi:hypothetical protein